MLTGRQSVEVAALHKNGWSGVGHRSPTGRDRKTMRRYLSDELTVGVRVRSTVDPFDRVEPYVRQGLGCDPHRSLVPVCLHGHRVLASRCCRNALLVSKASRGRPSRGKNAASDDAHGNSPDLLSETPHPSERPGAVCPVRGNHRLSAPDRL
jgi:hypothetical protein